MCKAGKYLKDLAAVIWLLSWLLKEAQSQRPDSMRMSPASSGIRSHQSVLSNAIVCFSCLGLLMNKNDVYPGLSNHTTCPFIRLLSVATVLF